MCLMMHLMLITHLKRLICDGDLMMAVGTTASDPPGFDSQSWSLIQMLFTVLLLNRWRFVRLQLLLLEPVMLL